MSKNSHSTFNQKAVYLFMAGAFFWLVMGELVILHQKLIYGYDVFHYHQHFTKPDKPGHKSKKTLKPLKLQDQFNSGLFAGSENDQKVLPAESSFDFGNTATACFITFLYSSDGSRAPPSL